MLFFCLTLNDILIFLLLVPDAERTCQRDWLCGEDNLARERERHLQLLHPVGAAVMAFVRPVDDMDNVGRVSYGGNPRIVLLWDAAVPRPFHL